MQPGSMEKETTSKNGEEPVRYFSFHHTDCSSSSYRVKLMLHKDEPCAGYQDQFFLAPNLLYRYMIVLRPSLFALIMTWVWLTPGLRSRCLILMLWVFIRAVKPKIYNSPGISTHSIESLCWVQACRKTCEVVLGSERVENKNVLHHRLRSFVLPQVASWESLLPIITSTATISKFPYICIFNCLPEIGKKPGMHASPSQSKTTICYLLIKLVPHDSADGKKGALF